MTKIVGIALLRNEENFATWAISNALEFCDEFLVVDNCSSDRTWGLCERLAESSAKVRLYRDADAARTNRYVQEYIGDKTWVFGVDGDEIHDRVGLARLRPRILAGELDQYWSIRGHMLHATTVDLEAATARGYITPFAAAPGKLYNFALVKRWREDRQRLHGVPELAEGAEILRAYRVEWDAADLKALHLCFFPRSSVDPDVMVRKNITDRFLRHAWRRTVFSALLGMGHWGEGVRRYLGRRALPIKNRIYMAGDIATKGLSDFGRPADHLAIDAEALRAEAVLAAVSHSRAAQPDLRTAMEWEYGASVTRKRA